MPFLPGIRRLSQLTIDVNRNWETRRISNLGVPVATGDALRMGTRLGMAEMPDGASGQVLAARGAGINPAFSSIDIDLNRVKLPTPATGDYVTPIGASSTIPPLISSATVLRRHADGVHNEAHIYDDRSDTASWPVPIMPAGDNRVFIVWDLGSIASREIAFNHIGARADVVNFLETSSDDITWTTQSSSTNNAVATGMFSASFRFLRWRGTRDAASTAGANSAWQLRIFTQDTAAVTIDDSLTTQWRPIPPNEAGAWCRWDTGALRILGGCRIFWGADAAFRPSAYRIQVSEDNVTWTTVVTETVVPPASAWKEYSFTRYGRFIRLIVDTHGASGTEIFETDYWSRLVDRVASEHGHGSGLTPHLKVEYSEGHPPMMFGDTLRDEVNRARARVGGSRRATTLPELAGQMRDLLELIDTQGKLVEFLSE